MITSKWVEVDLTSFGKILFNLAQQLERNCKKTTDLISDRLCLWAVEIFTKLLNWHRLKILLVTVNNWLRVIFYTSRFLWLAKQVSYNAVPLWLLQVGVPLRVIYTVLLWQELQGTLRYSNLQQPRGVARGQGGMSTPSQIHSPPWAPPNEILGKKVCAEPPFWGSASPPPMLPPHFAKSGYAPAAATVALHYMMRSM